MSRILKVSQSNYRIQTASGGTITLDTGTVQGSVIVTGNLDVKGTTTTVESSNTTIKDNILQLNFGETHNGISSTLNSQAGIQIGRGNYSDAQILFDENVTHYDTITSSNISGTFVLKTADNKKSGIQVATIVNDGATDLIFDLRNSNGVLRVANTTNYYQRVTNDNDIPNWKTITNYVAAYNGVAVVDRLYYPPSALFGQEDTKIQAYNSNIQFYVAQQTVATISPVGLSVNNVNLLGDSITNTSANNLVLTAINDIVEVNAVLALADRGTNPAVEGGVTKIYSAPSAGPGDTGIFFKNVNSQDELVSKNRAVLLSILL
jgi:hypothetical protein